MKTRRILSLVVAAIMLVSTLAVVGLLNVTAADDFIEIGTAEEFAAIEAGKNYKLTQDIDLTTIEFKTIAELGGVLDGNGKTVKTDKPLFATADGEIKNLTVEGNVTASGDTAAFVVGVYNTDALTITNCVNKASVTLESKNFVGGFVGTVTGKDNNNHASVTITHSFNYGTITAGDNEGSVGAAGFIGGGKDCDVTVTDCVNYGDVTQGAGDSGVAGIFGGASSWRNGKLTLTFKYTANHGTITGGNKSRAGGIAGRLDRNSGCTYTFEYCYNTGAITGGSSASGVSGYTNASAKVYAKHCYNIGALTSGVDGVYGIGIVGDNEDTRGEGNYFVGDGQIKEAKPFHVEATKLDTLEALIAALCVEGSVWEMQDGTAYPVIKHTTTKNCVGEICSLCGVQITSDGAHVETAWTVTTPATDLDDGLETETCTACGEEVDTRAIPANWTVTPAEDTYTVKTENDLLWIAHNLNKGTVPATATIVFENDITLTNGMTFINQNFTGTIDGKGHTLSGLTNTIFYQIGGTVKDITIEGTITTTESKAGTIAKESSFYGEAHILNVTSKVNMNFSTNGDNFGGFIGHAYGHNVIENSVYSGTMTFDNIKGNVGGMVGYSNRNGAEKSTEVINCLFDGAIVFVGNCGTVHVGGMIGYNNAAGGEAVKGSVVTGTITVGEGETTATVGGIFGLNRSSDKEVVIENTVFNGTIGGTGAIGAIAGSITEKTVITNTVALSTDYPIAPAVAGTVTNSYAKADVQALGDVIELGGVKYQRYNFGYLNVDESKFVTTGLTTEDAFAGYITMRDDGDKHDARIVLLANTKLAGNMLPTSVVIAFMKGEATVQSYTLTFGGENSDFEAFRAGIAAGEPYFAGEGCALFGVVVNDIPDEAWDTLTVTVTANGATEPTYTGSASYAE